MAELGQKKVRNHVLDLWKIYAAYLVFFTHCAQNVFPFMVDGQPSMTQYWGKWTVLEGSDWYPLGFFTLGFYTFTTAYWLMNAYQKNKAKGMFGKGHDLEMIYRYFAGNYVAYAPIAFVCALSGLIGIQIVAKYDVMSLINMIIKNISQFVGLDGWFWVLKQDTIVSYTMTGSFLNPETQFISFHPAAWYIESVLAFAIVFYTLLVVNEKLTVGVIAPLFCAAAIISVNTGGGLLAVVPQGFLTLWGTGMFGLVSWYLVNALQKIELSKKACTVMTIFTIILYVMNILQFFLGFYGLLQMDILIGITLIMTLACRDKFTIGLNNILSKLPLKKYWGDFALGVFIFHYPVFPAVKEYVLPKYGLNGGFIAALLGTTVCALIFVPIWRLLIAPFQKWFTKVLGLTNPIGNVLGLKKEEPAAK